MSENQGPGTPAPNSPRRRLRGVRSAPALKPPRLRPPVPELPGRGAQGDMHPRAVFAERVSTGDRAARAGAGPRSRRPGAQLGNPRACVLGRAKRVKCRGRGVWAESRRVARPGPAVLSALPRPLRPSREHVRPLPFGDRLVSQGLVLVAAGVGTAFLLRRRDGPRRGGPRGGSAGRRGRRRCGRGRLARSPPRSRAWPRGVAGPRDRVLRSHTVHGGHTARVTAATLRASRQRAGPSVPASCPLCRFSASLKEQSSECPR